MGIELRSNFQIYSISFSFFLKLFSIGIIHLQDENSVVKKILTTLRDGKSYENNFFNLDAIISVGYRVNSKNATHFIKWNTKLLNEQIINGFALDDDLLKLVIVQ